MSAKMVMMVMGILFQAKLLLNSSAEQEAFCPPKLWLTALHTKPTSKSCNVKVSEQALLYSLQIK